MTPDDLERQLQRRTLQPLDAAWRREILSAAFASRAESIVPEPARRAWWLRRGAGWPALAAVWMVIAGLHFANIAAEPKMPMVAVSPEALNRHWLEERRWLAEFLPPVQPPEIPHSPVRRPKSSSRMRAAHSFLPA